MSEYKIDVWSFTLTEEEFTAVQLLLADMRSKENPAKTPSDLETLAMRLAKVEDRLAWIEQVFNKVGRLV